MEITTKKVTGRQILEAMEKNGLEHASGEWFNYDLPEDYYISENFKVNPKYLENAFKPTIKAACIMGQAAINLGVDTYSLQTKTDTNFKNFASKMISLNDGVTPSGKKRDYTRLVELARKKLESFLDKEISIETASYITRKDAN